jgi:putative oxidoreductase
MFPVGAPGIALLLLRISLAAAVLATGADCIKPSLPGLIFFALAVQSLLLCLGFMTPVVSIIACVFELTGLFIAGHTDGRFIALSGLNAAAVTLLGPGAYSLDARLFGRREIVFHPGAKPNRS